MFFEPELIMSNGLREILRAINRTGDLTGIETKPPRKIPWPTKLGPLYLNRKVRPLKSKMSVSTSPFVEEIFKDMVKCPPYSEGKFIWI
jgi:hypothetical protein